MIDLLVINIMKNEAYPDLDHMYVNYSSIWLTSFGIKIFGTTNENINQKYWLGK
jgi:hypothetical protein